MSSGTIERGGLASGPAGRLGLGPGPPRGPGDRHGGGPAAGPGPGAHLGPGNPKGRRSDPVRPR